MTSANSGGYRAEINVTPMIDVLLVLLIIFMVVAPVLPKGLNTLVPQPAAGDQPLRPLDLVVQVVGPGVVELNQQPMSLAELNRQLRRIVERRGDAVVFVRGGRDLEYRDVAEVIDLARGAGIVRVGLMSER